MIEGVEDACARYRVTRMRCLRDDVEMAPSRATGLAGQVHGQITTEQNVQQCERRCWIGFPSPAQVQSGSDESDSGGWDRDAGSIMEQ